MQDEAVFLLQPFGAVMMDIDIPVSHIPIGFYIGIALFSGVGADLPDRIIIQISAIRHVRFHLPELISGNA